MIGRSGFRWSCFASFLVLAGCGGLGNSNSTVNASQVETVSAVRSMRLYQAFATTVLANLTGTPNTSLQFDGNLYYKASVSGAVTTISYSTDSAGISAAGTVTATNTSATGASSTTYAVAVNIIGGSRPVSGNLLVTVGTGGTSVSTTGSVTVNALSGQFPITLNVTSVSGAVSGSMTGVSGGTTVALSGIQGSTTSTGLSFTANASLQPQAVRGTLTVTLNTDSSGSSSLSDGTTFSWTVAGAGAITYPKNGGTTNIGNVDIGD